MSGENARSIAAFSSDELRFLLNLDDRLLEIHCLTLHILHCSTALPNLWSGRRESNPRPTAWKAVTLPLSYSRETQLSAISRQLSAKAISYCYPPLATSHHLTKSLEPMTRIELVTSPLPRECSTN